jgi:hypothetical protein
LSPEDLANYAKVAQSLSVAVAVIIGGTWTLFTFVRLGTIKKAKAELERLQQELLEQAIVSIKVNASQLDDTENEGYVLAGEAIVSNKGNRNTLIDFSSSDCCVITKITFDDDGQTIIGDSFYAPFYMTYYLRAGAEINFSFITKVPEPGIYKILVSSPLHNIDATQASALTKEEGHRKYIWQGVKYISVVDKGRA